MFVCFHGMGVPLSKVWVRLFVPGHHLVQILVVLLEASELLLDKHATTIVKVMGRQVLQVLHTHPSVHALLLAVVLIGGVHAAEQT